MIALNLKNSFFLFLSIFVHGINCKRKSINIHEEVKSWFESCIPWNPIRNCDMYFVEYTSAYKPSDVCRACTYLRPLTEMFGACCISILSQIFGVISYHAFLHVRSFECSFLSFHLIVLHFFQLTNWYWMNEYAMLVFFM